MKFTFEELSELTQSNGGRFKIYSDDEAFDFCQKLAQSHYENFPVASFLIKKEWKKYVFSVYAFARIADDIADEITEIPVDERLKMIEQMEALLNEKVRSNMTNPVFIALKRTMIDKEITSEPFKKLLTAYKMDINFKQAETFYDLLDYCKYSAEPIGELVLKITENYNENNIILSNKICSALQLINFWQDFSIDLKNNRVFIPSEYLEKYKLNINDLFERKKTHKLLFCLDELYNQTETLLIEGSKLVKYLDNLRVKLEIKATVLGGLEILKKIRNLHGNILDARPKLGKKDFFVIFTKVLFSKI